MAAAAGKETVETVNPLGAAAATDDKTVEVTLANFLPERAAKDFGLTVREYKPGEKIKLHRDDAQSLISQGAVAGIDPSDDQAVAKVLGIR